MLSKFFRRTPRKGMPLAQSGLADALAGMDKAWATLDVLGGMVQWDHGKPLIITPEGRPPYVPPYWPFNVLLLDGWVDVFLPDPSTAGSAPPGAGAGLYRLAGVSIPADTTLTSGTSPHWFVAGQTIVPAKVYVKMQQRQGVSNEDYVPGLPSSTEYTIEVLTTAPTEARAAQYTLIADIVDSSGTLVVRNRRQGTIGVNPNMPDTYAQSVNPVFPGRSRSIENYDGTERLYNFKSPATNALSKSDLTSTGDKVHFVMRYPGTGTNPLTEVRYLLWEVLEAAIEDTASGVISGAGLTKEHNDLSGLQGGNSPTNTQMYHLTAGQHMDLTGTGVGSLEERLLAIEGRLDDLEELLDGYTDKSAADYTDTDTMLIKAAP